MDIKNDLSTEVRTLTKRMTHIDEQIGQIFNFLSPFHSSINNNPSPTHDTTQISTIPPPLPQQLSPVPPLLITATTPTEINNPTTVNMSPLFEAPSFYSDINTKIPFFDANQPSSNITDVYDVSSQSKTNEQLFITHQTNENDSPVLSIPPPPSVYNRSARSSISSLNTSIIPRGSASNKIVPAPLLSSPSSPKHASSTSFRPISNTRLNPGRSPKPKARSHQNRFNIKHHQQPEQSTIIELESPTEHDATNKNVPSLSTSLSSTTKSSSNIFRRFMTDNGNTDKTGTTSSTLLYPPTSDDERPMSPTSSGNDDDDCRPLTSSSSKYHHQTPL